MKTALLIALALAACGLMWIASRTTRDVVRANPPREPVTSVQPPVAAVTPLPDIREPVTPAEVGPPPPAAASVPPAPPPWANSADSWRNRGARTPREALETIFWAKEGADVEVLFALIDFSVFTESDLRDAANCLATISHERRRSLGISSPEDFIALAWSVSGKARFGGAFLVSEKSRGPDEVELRVQLVGRQDALGFSSFSGNHPFVLRRTLEGWQWRPQPHDISALKDSWTSMVEIPSRGLSYKGPARR